MAVNWGERHDRLPGENLDSPSVSVSAEGTSPTRPPRPALGRTTTALAEQRGSGWAPILAALAIDLADLAMIGPTGLVAGFFVGGVLTLVLTLSIGVPLRRASALALLGAIYCMLPITDVVPLATMLTGLRMILVRRQAEAPTATPAPEQPEAQAPAGARVVQAGPGRR